MAIVKVMNKDETGTSPANKVTGEELAVTKGTPQKLAHSIFFQDGFYIYEKVNDRANTLLRRGVDFDFTSEDTIATEISNKNCWKEIIVYKDVATVYLDYQVYGDFVTAEFINAVKAQTGNATEQIKEFNRSLDAAREELKTHKDDTAPHGASADAAAKSLALRTATGTLKAAKATANDELVNLELLKEIERALNAELTDAFQKVDNELADIIRAGKPAISIGDFGLQEEAERGKELNKRVNETAAYHNALRNERGSLAVPEAVSDAEAVNKKQLETHVSRKIAELVDGAPGTLDTLKEIADALNGEAGIVDTLTQQIANAKTEAVQAAEADATSKANDAQAEAVKKAKAEATQYTDGKLADYYTKTEVDDSQRVQNERIKKLEAARPTSGAGALYDFSKAEAVKTGETIKLSDGTVKDIYRLCVGRENVQDNFTIDTSTIGTISRILRINGTLTQTNGVVESATGAVKLLVKDLTKKLLVSFNNQSTTYSVILLIEFIN